MGAQASFQGSFRGVWFIFCSPECRERFLADPARFLAGDEAGGNFRPSRHWLSGDPGPAREAAGADVVVLDDVRGKRSPGAGLWVQPGPPTLPTLERWIPSNAVLAADEVAASAAVHDFHHAAAPQRGDVTRSRIFSFLVPMQQRKFARQVSRELLTLGRCLQERTGGLRGYDLYRAVVRERLQIDDMRANALLELADQSFASWPTPRAINFADVVHMVVVTEFRARFGARPWIEANLGAVVARQIPREL